MYGGDVLAYRKCTDSFKAAEAPTVNGHLRTQDSEDSNCFIRGVR